METNIYALREVIDGVEKTLKEALREYVVGSSSHRLDNKVHIESALKSVQEASVALLKVR